MASTKVSFNAYRLYESNIHKILQWLATTARTSEVGDDILQQIVKKKNTKKTTKANKISSKGNDAVRISIENLQELAKAVADMKTVKVPEDIIAAAKYISSLVLECHAWFVTHGLETESIKHTTEEQKTILDTIDQNIAKVEELSQAMENVSGLLCRPLVDESSETSDPDSELSELTAAVTDLTLGLSSDESTLHYELDAPTQHEALALYSFLKDCTSVQIFVARTWQEFRDGTVGLSSASLLTNTAIAMMQEWNSQVRATLPRLRNSNTRSMHKILKDIVNAEYCYFDNIIQQPSLGEVDDEVAFPDVPIATTLSDYTLSQMTKAFEFKKGKSKYYPDHYQKKDKTFFRCISQLGGLQYYDINLRDKLQETRKRNESAQAAEEREIKKGEKKKSTSTDLWPGRQYYRMKASAEVKDVEDDEETYKQCLWKYDYTYKACSLFLAGQKDSWIIYAAQILRDTQRRLEEDASEGLDMLQDQAHVLTPQYEKYLNDAGIDHTSKKQKQWKQDVEEQLNFLQKAIVESDFQNLANKLEVKRESDTGEDVRFSLLGNHPMLCGILLNETRNRFQKISIDIASEQGHIMAVAHLYNAAHDTGYLHKSTTWVDMDWFIERQGNEWVFGGERPKLPSDYVEAICAAFGLDPSKFELDRAKASRSRGASRRLRFLTQYLELDVKRETVRSGKIVGETEVSHDMGAKMKVMASEYDGSAAGTETLTPLRVALEKDEVASNFNVLGFHMKCLRLLRQIRDACLEGAPKGYPADIYDKSANLNLIAVELLRDLTGCDRQNKRMFLKATECMRKLIEADGEEGVEQATRLTECMRISQDDEDDEDRESSSEIYVAESNGSGHEPLSDGSDVESEDGEEGIESWKKDGGGVE